MNVCPTSSTVVALERWVEVLLVVVGGRGRTKRGQVLDGATQVWGEVSVSSSTGLVPGLAAYPSSTTVESERVGVMVVVWGRRPDLSDDKVAIEDVGSELEGSKKWG